MQENNVIKSITQHVCPKCGGDIFVESQMAPPAVSSLFTKEEVEKAKADCLARIEMLTLIDEKRDAVKKWLADPNTVFGPHEVEVIIMSLLKPE